MISIVDLIKKIKGKTKKKYKQFIKYLINESEVNDHIRNELFEYGNSKYFIHPGKVTQLGFPNSSPSYIPDEYLQQGDFVILRTSFGISDWAVISAMPRKLKEKYPDCKVRIPSPKLLKQMFAHLEIKSSLWYDTFQIVHIIFDNNPYVDGFIDSFKGDIFNDHHRINKGDEDSPLLEQILRFWQFTNIENIEPEIYWTEKEKQLGLNIINDHCNGEFGTLSISSSYNNEGFELIQQKIDEYDLPMFYWTESQSSGFKFKKALDMRHIDVRVQMFIKSLAKFNIGNQNGINKATSNYTISYTVCCGKLRSNFLKSEIYL